MYLLCNTNLIISYKKQLLLLTLGGWLEEKIGQIRSQSKYGTVNK